ARLAEQLQQLADDGRDPAEYLPVRLPDPASTPLRQACDELQASHAYLQALRHLAYGRYPRQKLEPLRQPTPRQADDGLLLVRAVLGRSEERRGGKERKRRAPSGARHVH